MKRQLVTRINMANGNIVQLSHPGKKLVGKERCKRLYHYTSFGNFLKIYYGQKLKFGKAINMNDIIEANKRMASDNIIQAPLLFALKDIIASYKQISFTMDYDSLIKGCMSNSMWYHYGDKLNGVCIEFDFDMLKTHLPTNTKHGAVSYKNLMPDNIILPSNASTIHEIEVFVKRRIKDLFFTKTMEWKYENEYRILCQDKDYLDIEGAITALYFTSCDSEYVRVAEEIVKGTIPVRYINYYSECGDITPIDDNAKSMREKIEGVKARRKNSKTRMQQAEDYYEKYKSDKNKSLLMHSFDNS